MKWMVAVAMVVGACGARGDSAAAQQAKSATDQLVVMQAKVDSLAAQVELANHQLAAIGQQLADLRTSMAVGPTSPVVVAASPDAPAAPPRDLEDPFAVARPRAAPAKKPAESEAAQHRKWCEAHAGDVRCIE